MYMSGQAYFCASKIFPNDRTVTLCCRKPSSQAGQESCCTALNVGVRVSVSLQKEGMFL